MDAAATYQEISFKVPLNHREKELVFFVGRTVGEEDGCVKIKEAFDDPEKKNKYLLKLVFKQEVDGLSHKPAFMRKLNTDLCIMKLLDTKHVVKLYHTFNSGPVVYILLEHTPSTLEAVLTSHPDGLPAAVATGYFKQMCSAVGYLHNRALCHRNLTPSCFKFDETSEMLKLGDFGHACFQPSKELLRDHPMIRPTYASPELLGDDCYNGKASDVWSLGCILYKMLTGREYKQGCDLTELSGAGEVLRMMLVEDASERATVEDVMESKWLEVEKDDVGKLLAKHGSMEDLEAYTNSELQANMKRIGTGLGLDALDTEDSTDVVDGTFSPLAFRDREVEADNDGLSPGWSSDRQPPSFELSPTANTRMQSRLTVDVFDHAISTDATMDFSPMHRTRN